MGKRKAPTDENYDSDEEIRRKIRKYERKLLKRSQARTRDVCVSDQDVEKSNSQCSWLDLMYPNLDSAHKPLSPDVLVDDNNEPLSPETQPRQHAPSPSPVPSPPPRAPSPPPHVPPSPPRAPSPTPSTSKRTQPEKEVVPEDIDLDVDILQLLGDAPKSDTPMGPSIHKDVASRWQEILAKGLPKEVKDKIYEEYLIPSNCDLLTAPKLNPEAKAALSDILVKRDSFMMHKQKQLGVALSAMATAITMILKNESSKQKLLKPISDACRILCDNHYTETKSRRNMVISSTNTQLKDSLLESVRDKTWLFGDNISEKLKAAKTIQKTGDDLKNQPKTFPRPNNTQAKNARGRLNYRGLHRKTESKPAASNSSDSSRGRPQARAPPAPPPPTRSAYRYQRRSPPPSRRQPYK